MVNGFDELLGPRIFEFREFLIFSNVHALIKQKNMFINVFSSIHLSKPFHSLDSCSFGMVVSSNLLGLKFLVGQVIPKREIVTGKEIRLRF